MNISRDGLELPPSWLSRAGMTAFYPRQSSYVAGANENANLPAAEEVPLAAIRPPKRSPGIQGLVEDRTISILRALATNTPLPPVIVYSVPDGSFAYRLGAGFHRYYISRLVGFQAIPANVLDYWEPWMTGDPMPCTTDRPPHP